MTPHEIVAMLNAAGVVPKNLTADSRVVGAGDVFVAYPGRGGQRDGRAYIGAAITRGAAAVLWESEDFVWNPAWQVPNVAVPGLKPLAGQIASVVYGAPSAQLIMVGVTGTNGKTSVSTWTAQALERCGVPCGVIGTLGSRFRGAGEALANTTPDAIVLQATLGRMRDAGAQACAVEVSSIGLDQARVAGVAFDIGVFTNLTRDHLDYHGTMAAYENAKTGLFLQTGLQHAVVNLDDPMGVRLMARLGGSLRRIGYCIAGKSAVVPHVEDEGRLTAHDLRFDALGVRFRLAGDFGESDVSAPVWGEFNVANLLAVLGVLLAAGVPFARAVAALAMLEAVPGRMNAMGGSNAPLVVIDYAHTPDALQQALAALRPLASARGGRLVAVFGCGGDRDAGKRAPMGMIAAQLADAVLLTSDNPRGEDPLAILAQIAAGAPAARMEVDRAQAILLAVGGAGAADVVLIAGKGHEAVQEVAGRKLPFSDHDVASRALQARDVRDAGSETTS